MKIITVRFNNEEEIITKENPTEYRNDWDITKIIKSKKYKVEFQYSEKKLIDKIIITENNAER